MQDLQTELQLPRPLDRRMEKYVKDALEQRGDKEAANADAKEGDGSTAEGLIETPQTRGPGSAYTQIGSVIQVQRRHTVVWPTEAERRVSALLGSWRVSALLGSWQVSVLLSSR